MKNPNVVKTKKEEQYQNWQCLIVKKLILSKEQEVIELISSLVI